MTLLYDRLVRLTLAKPKGFFDQSTDNAIIIEDFRVKFTIEKHLGKNPNTAEIIVTNLAERTRGELQDRLHVLLEAGYGGGFSRLFSGDSRFIRHYQTGTDWESRIQAGDGERAYRWARVKRSFKAGVSAEDAVRELAKAMELKPPANTRSLRRQYVGGLSLSGNAAAELDRVLTPLGKTWSIQDGQLQILGASEVRKNQAVVLEAPSDANGGRGTIIGSPELGAPPAKGKAPVLTVKCLLEPNVVPGGRIQVISRQFNKALFKVDRVVHEGDSRGAEFYTTIEAKPV